MTPCRSPVRRLARTCYLAAAGQMPHHCSTRSGGGWVYLHISRPYPEHAWASGHHTLAHDHVTFNLSLPRACIARNRRQYGIAHYLLYCCAHTLVLVYFEWSRIQLKIELEFLVTHYCTTVRLCNCTTAFLYFE